MIDTSIYFIIIGYENISFESYYESCIAIPILVCLLLCFIHRKNFFYYFFPLQTLKNTICCPCLQQQPKRTNQLLYLT